MSGTELIAAACFLFHSREVYVEVYRKSFQTPILYVKRINIHFSTLFNSLVPRAFLREKRGGEVACLI